MSKLANCIETKMRDLNNTVITIGIVKDCIVSLVKIKNNQEKALNQCLSKIVVKESYSINNIKSFLDCLQECLASYKT